MTIQNVSVVIHFDESKKRFQEFNSHFCLLKSIIIIVLLLNIGSRCILNKMLVSQNADIRMVMTLVFADCL